jgi:N-methyl-L-tryptophan oxidase
MSKVSQSFFDVIIVGGGSMGSAAAYYLSRQKKKVLVIDQFSIPNQIGSHHGQTRMLRLGYGNGGKYIPLVKHSLHLWKELEKATGKRLYYQTGALTVGFSGSTFVKESIESSIKFNLDFEIMTSEKIMERWPGIRVPDHYIGCYDPEAGFLMSEDCILTYKNLAIDYGAVVKECEPVVDLIIHDDEVQIQTSSSIYTAAKLIVTAGAWLPALLKPLELPIQPIRKTIGWFQPLKEQLYNEGFPCFVFDTEKDGHYYGFPDFNGLGVKLGRMDTGYQTDPNHVKREFGSYVEDEGDVRRFLENYMPNAAGPLANGKVCMFSNTPDSDFIVDFHPSFSNVILAGGFSGHGFKFASVIGSILSDLVLDGSTNYDISFLDLQRFEKNTVL